MTKYLLVSMIGCAMGAAACGGSPTGATCPTDNTLGYANGSAGTDGNFGSEFFATYCTDCHAASSTNRHGAPGDQNFDSLADIILHADDIDSEAASGPAATNTDMPQLDTKVTAAPSTAERVKLGQFLACATAGSGS